MDEIQALPQGRSETVEIARGGTLGQTLTTAGVFGQQNQNLVIAFRERAEPRRLRAGTRISLHWQGVPELLRGVEVAVNADSTVRLERTNDLWRSSVVISETAVDTVIVSGEISGVLWTSVNQNPHLATLSPGDRGGVIHSLDQVFQWQIDFSRQIRVGDSYRFVMERELRTDGSMRSSTILSAEIVNQNKPFQAIWFDPNNDGVGTWYDPEGRSVRRAFLLKPLDFRRISSRFTNSRFHPVLQRWRAHRGVDYAADSGTPVMATGNGTIVRRGWSDTYGRVVDIRHPNGFLTRYAHFSRFAGGQSVGSLVSQGQVIGYVGMTGMATGPHLHYEMHVNGSPRDPLAIELPPEDDVPADDWQRWEREKSERLGLLLLAPPKASNAQLVADELPLTDPTPNPTGASGDLRR